MQEISMLNDVLKRGLMVPLFIVIILAMMILPLPALILDMLFTFNITLSLIILLAAIYSGRPLDFASFPTVLLIATLLRLALNIASTRVILLHGHQGANAAGQVIESFGQVVVGGSFAVGIIVFIILVIINFIVVTKGAGRISEVSARFTLDAMPGKQMAIDADLNAGIINQNDAKLRREEIGLEADFYGSMDGASKFVRGDAIAGILILLINLVGGVGIGTLQHGLSILDALRLYALLSIGDGLVAQIPGLLLSVAAAILVTRVSAREDMGQEVVKQLFASSKPLFISGGILFVMGLVPGMPHIAFMGLGGLLAWTGLNLSKKATENIVEEVATETPQTEETANKEANREVSWEDVPQLDPISLEIGYRLIPMVDKAQKGELMGRIKGVRKKLSQELGFLVPSVHIRDDLNLSPNAYRISLQGVISGEYEIQPDRDMAINPGQVFGKIEGIATKDPAFGLEAYWIEKSKREQAQTMGYTVVDSSTVVATHLSQILSTHAHTLLGHDEVQAWLDLVAKTSKKMVDDLVPGAITMAGLVKVLQQLLLEGVSIRDSRAIIETILEYGPKVQDISNLIELIRQRLGAMIVQQLNGSDSEIHVMTLDVSLENMLQSSQNNMNEAGIEPTLASRIQQNLKKFSKNQEITGKAPVLLVLPQLRRMLSKFVRNSVPGLAVLSYLEIPDNKSIKVVSTLG